MKKIILIFTLLLSCFSLWFCQKKLFGKIEVKGRLLSFYTNEPIKASVELYGDDATSAKNSTEHSIMLATGQSNDDGTFYLKSKPSKRGRYYLHIDGKTWLQISADDNQMNDLSDIILGKKTFYCRINIMGSSSSSITFYPGSYSKIMVSFNAHTTTQFLHSITYSKSDFEPNNHNYLIEYWTDNGVKTYASINLPITTADTLSVTIPY